MNPFPCALPEPDLKDPLEWGGLLLTPEDLQALARQGFLAQELRRGRGPYYKLRWRQGGRQRVLYLGRDPARAERVRALLEHLQRPFRLARQLARLLQETRKHLHKAKSLLESQAQTQGLHYHGYSARRTLSPQEGSGPRAADHTLESECSFPCSPTRSPSSKEGRRDER